MWTVATIITNKLLSSSFQLVAKLLQYRKVDCHESCGFLHRVNSGASGFNLGVKRKANDDEAKTKKAAVASSKAKQPKQKTSVLEQIMQVGVILACYYWSFSVML